MLRKCICLIVALGAVLAAPAQASARTGSLQVMPVWCGEPVEGGSVSLYRVGTGSEIQVTDGLANWTVGEGDVLTPEWVQWILQNGQTQVRTSPVTASGALFQDLEEGVYLVHQPESRQAYSVFQPFLLRVPDGADWDIIRKPGLLRLGESPRTGDHPAPIIGAMGIGFSVAVLMVLVDNRKK